MAEYFEKNGNVSFMSWARLLWSGWPDAGELERLTHFHFPWKGSHQVPVGGRSRQAGLLLFYSKHLRRFISCNIIQQFLG
jgi:hypothetical protein